MKTRRIGLVLAVLLGSEACADQTEPGEAIDTGSNEARLSSSYDSAVLALPSLKLFARLNEPSGSVAADGSASHLNGTISAGGVTYGATDTLAASGGDAKALRLTTGSVSFPSNTAFNLSTTASARWTLILDVKLNANSGYPQILAKGDPNANGWQIFADPATGAVGFKINGKQYAWQGLPLTTMANLALSFDGTRLGFFLNGQKVAESTPTAATVSNGSALVLGGSGDVTVSKLIVTASADTASIPTLYRALTTVTNPNLALGKPATASSIEGTGYEAAKGVDGNGASRWASAASDPQWLYVDLGQTYAVNRVKLNWETAYAKAYQIQVSDNASTWRTIFTTTTGDGATDDLTGLAGTGRYVRVYGTTRATQWGYSLWDFEVYGSAGTSPPGDATPPSVALQSPASGTTYSSAQTVTLQATAADNVGVSKVEFFDGAVLKATDTASPFTYAWTIGSADNGAHSWTAKAYDAAGNSKVSAPIALNVNIASGAVQPLGVGGAWTIAFQDEFNGTSLDLTKWDPHWYSEGGVMNGVGTYAANVSVGGGVATLTLASANSGALINTQSNNGFEVAVGMFAEARCSFGGNGSRLYNWSSWWISGTPWPNAGEHDIAEILAGQLTVNYHSPSGAHNQGAVAGYWGDAFHVYGIHRKASSADVYWDGRLVKSYATDDNRDGQSLVFNVGRSELPGYGAAGATKIDYVRVWK